MFVCSININIQYIIKYTILRIHTCKLKCWCKNFEPLAYNHVVLTGKKLQDFLLRDFLPPASASNQLHIQLSLLGNPSQPPQFPAHPSTEELHPQDIKNLQAWRLHGRLPSHPSSQHPRSYSELNLGWASHPASPDSQRHGFAQLPLQWSQSGTEELEAQLARSPVDADGTGASEFCKYGCTHGSWRRNPGWPPKDTGTQCDSYRLITARVIKVGSYSQLCGWK